MPQLVAGRLHAFDMVCEPLSLIPYAGIALHRQWAFHVFVWLIALGGGYILWLAWQGEASKVPGYYFKWPGIVGLVSELALWIYCVLRLRYWDMIGVGSEASSAKVPDAPPTVIDHE